MSQQKKKIVTLKAAQEEIQHLGLSGSGTFFGFLAPNEILPEIEESQYLENSIKVYFSKYKNREDKGEKRSSMLHSYWHWKLRQNLEISWSADSCRPEMQ
ncbi:unnamed protein product [Blepharisma stoltei]|uniref:Uncharacterized protein n=1 Tax=Blepharisma stoltei TaxID=1481888 RepID=A0AAU9JEF0_9CILI|nr:unnamed protein product [Blepharisma stoltei]